MGLARAVLCSLRVKGWMITESLSWLFWPDAQVATCHVALTYTVGALKLTGMLQVEYLLAVVFLYLHTISM